MATILVNSKGHVTGEKNGKKEKDLEIREDIVKQMSKKFRENERRLIREKRERERSYLGEDDGSQAVSENMSVYKEDRYAEEISRLEQQAIEEQKQTVGNGQELATEESTKRMADTLKTMLKGME